MNQNNPAMKASAGGWLLLALYLIAAALGAANGIWGGETGHAVADFISTLFIRVFKFVAVPIIAVSIISTLASLSANSGRLFRRTIFYTLFTTVLAATLAALLYEVFAPANVSIAAAEPMAALANANGGSYLKYVESVIPDNILAPFLSANVLSCVFTYAIFPILFSANHFLFFYRFPASIILLGLILRHILHILMRVLSVLQIRKF